MSEVAYTGSDGAAIAYSVHGAGDVDVVLVPGFVSNVDLIWDEPRTARFLRRLSSFARLILYDKRGQGLSDRPPHPPTLEESMADVLAVMDAAGSERASLFGVSEGGPMAILTAATHPSRVSALALYGTYARLLQAPDYPAGIPEEAFRTWSERLMHDWGGPVMVSLWAPSARDDAGFAQWWSRFLRQGTSPRGAIELMELYRHVDVRAILPEPPAQNCRCPVLA